MKRDQNSYACFGTDFIFLTESTVVIDFLITSINSSTHSSSTHILPIIISCTRFDFASLNTRPDVGSTRNFQVRWSGCPSSPSQKSHWLMIQTFTRYTSCGRIHQESICKKSSGMLNCRVDKKSHLLMIQIYTRYLSCGRIQSYSASSRYTESDTGLIRNL